MSHVPVIMLPLRDAERHGIVEEGKQEEKFRLSRSGDVKFDPLKHVNLAKELGREEDDWLDVEFQNRMVRIYLSPNEEYRMKSFDTMNFRRIMMKYSVAPILVGGELYLFKWGTLGEVFGLAKLIDYLWDFHEINYYFDRGTCNDPIEPSGDSTTVQGVPEDTGRTLRDLLESGKQVEAREVEQVPDGNTSGEGEGDGCSEEG